MGARARFDSARRGLGLYPSRWGCEPGQRLPERAAPDHRRLLAFPFRDRELERRGEPDEFLRGFPVLLWITNDAVSHPRESLVERDVCARDPRRGRHPGWPL